MRGQTSHHIIPESIGQYQGDEIDYALIYQLLCQTGLLVEDTWEGRKQETKNRDRMKYMKVFHHDGYGRSDFDGWFEEDFTGEKESL